MSYSKPLQLVGANSFKSQVEEFAAAAGRSACPILLTGETGTGKTHIARYVFQFAEKFKENLGVLPLNEIAPDLFESQLFGHSKGAFTGAVADFSGLLEANAGGTVLLEEIDSLPVHLQAKILRVIEEGKFLSLGHVSEKHVRLRFIATALRCPRKLIGEGLFRMDLFQRLNVLSLRLPPLRERREDIPFLIDHFQQKMAERYQRQAFKVRDDAMQMLIGYCWPGNVRELHAEVERWFVFVKAGVGEVRLEHLRLEEVHLSTRNPIVKANSGQSEKERLLNALRLARWNKTSAAKAYGVSRKHFYTLLDRYGIK